MKRSASKKRTRTGDAAGNTADAVYKDALAAARALKRRHRAFCERDLNTFRVIIRKAQSPVFHRKPGPKPDPNVRGAALERARGTSWEVLYPKYMA